MSNQESPNTWQHTAREAFLNLKKAINTAPIGELRAVLEKDLGLDANRDWQDLRDSVDDLLTHAALGDPRSIGVAIDLRQKLVDILELLGGKPEAPIKNLSQSSAVPIPDVSWQKEINKSVNILCGITEQHPNMMEQELEQTLCNFPQANFSFPLDCLLDTSELPDKFTLLISDICDRMIQLRFDAECKQVINDLTDKSVERLPIPRGLGARSREKNGPTEITRNIFCKLERVRTQFRNKSELEELRKNLNEMPSPSQLNERFITETNQSRKRDKYPSAPAPQTKNQSAEESERMPVSYNRKRREEPLFHNPHLSKEFQLAAAPNSMAQQLEIQSHWITRAALLPPLTVDKSAIKNWVEAALCWVICIHKRGLKDITLAKEIADGRNNTLSTFSAFKLFLTEGFETLAGKDRKKQEP